MTGQPRTTANSLRHPAFLLSAFLLLTAAISAGPGASVLNIQLRKLPVPLRKDLTKLDKTALGQYQFLRANTIESAVLAGLRTNEYIDWEFQDTSIPDSDNPLKKVRLFVTHNTGEPNMTVHVPDQCWVGSGYAITERGNAAMELDSASAGPIEVPLRAVTFSKSKVMERGSPTVVYTFHCNGKFLNTQQKVNSALIDPRDAGAYFSKIEVTFVPNDPHVPYPPRDATIEAAKRFMSCILPVLMRDHLPDWEQWKSMQEGSGSNVPVAVAGRTGSQDVP